MSDNDEPFYTMRDKNNEIKSMKFSKHDYDELEAELGLQEKEELEEVELELSEEGLREKKEPDPESEPIWTVVRGGASFYYICPICAASIPGTGPHLMGTDGVKRTPKEHHYYYHLTIACDWYF